MEGGWTPDYDYSLPKEIGDEPDVILAVLLPWRSVMLPHSPSMIRRPFSGWETNLLSGLLQSEWVTNAVSKVLMVPGGLNRPKGPIR